MNQNNNKKRILLKTFKIIKCRKTKCLKMFDEKGIEKKKSN